MKYLALLALICLPLMSGCTRFATTLANIPAVFGDYELQRDLSYGEQPRQRLDTYVPVAAPTGPRPIVVFFYGGGWAEGAKEQYRFVAEALTSRGFVVVVPDYRLYPEVRFPAFVEDAAQAVRWAHEHATSLGADPEKLFLMGHSAGAHIAAMLACDEHYLEAVSGSGWIKGFVGLAGPYDFLPFTDPEVRAVFASAANEADTQPIHFVDGKEPPALLLHGDADERVLPRNSRNLAARIREKGGRVNEKYYAGMSHGGIVAALTIYLRGKETVLDEIDRFIATPADKTG